MIPQTELHRHLDVSIRPQTLLQFLQKKGLQSESTTLESFKKFLIIQKPLENLNQVLSRMTICQPIFDSFQVCEQISFECVEDCYHEGTRYIELRYAPSFVSEITGLDWNEALLGFKSGLDKAQKKYPQISAHLICIGVRDYDPQGPLGIHQTVDFFLKHQNKFCGFDLAGNESQHTAKEFESAFLKLKKTNGTKITIHAGESTGPEWIWNAIEILGANRIGHGLSATQDPKLLELLREKKIGVETCPTSNWITQGVKNLTLHPLKIFIQNGILASISTDDPTVFGTTLEHEYELAKTKIGLTNQELILSKQAAWETRFFSTCEPKQSEL